MHRERIAEKMRRSVANRFTGGLELNAHLNVGIETYQKTSNVSIGPKCAFTKTRRPDPFAVDKEQLRPNIGPNSYVPAKLDARRSSDAIISPTKYNRSTIDIKRTRRESLLGPGRYVP